MKKILLFYAIISLLTSAPLAVLWPDKALAVSGNLWQAGSIISDAMFTNSNEMSVVDIQNFLNSKVPSCDTNGTQPATEYGRSDLTHAQYAASRGWAAPPYVCLRNYYEVPKTAPGSGIPANNYTGSIPAGAISAAQMIYNAAQNNAINPRVLLVKLATESSGPLTTDTWPLQKQYTYAMGAHCPDSGPNGSANCDPNYSGFSIQISESAALLRWYIDSMTQSWWQYKKPYQTNSILWNVSTTGCGAGNVYLENKATAALYTYTPYQPNAAALANMYGTGNSCSAYGNRNFWRVYNDWFGPTNGPLFRTMNSPDLYYSDGIHKFNVPSMQLMSEYGYTLANVRYVTQQQIDSWALGTSPLSSSLGQIVKSPDDSDADGGSVYYIGQGVRYTIGSLDQLVQFGFSNDITYLPLDVIQSIPLGSDLSNFVQGPDMSVYKIVDNKKRAIFELSKLAALNPSGNITPLTESALSRWEYGVPYVDDEFVSIANDNSIRFYTSSTSYYSIPSMDIYECLSLGKIKTFRIWSQIVTNGTSDGTAGCAAQDTNNITYIMNGPVRYPAPNGMSFFSIKPTAKLLENTTVAQLGSVIKGPQDGLAVIESGTLRYIPSMQIFSSLGFVAGDITQLPDSVIKLIPRGGDKLSVGTIARTADGGISVVNTPNSSLSVISMQQYDDFAMDISGFIPINQATATAYPVSAVLPLFSNDGTNIFMVDAKVKYLIDPSLDVAYGFDHTNVVTVDAKITHKLLTWNLSRFIKSPTNPAVYYMDAGKKRPISSWQKVTEMGGANSVVTLSESRVNSFPTGSGV